MTAAPYRADWQERAACAGEDLRMWFATNPQAAKKICGRCPVRAECLYDALQHETPHTRYGVRGGLSAPQRRGLPDLDGRPKAEAIAVLRDLLDAAPQDEANPPERNPEPMTTTQTPAPAASDPTGEELPVGKLLAWGDAHLDPEVQDQAARARAALAGLRKRYDTDRELTAITTEAEKLQKRLAELRAREEELAPPKPKTRKKSPLDYDAATVRAWAKANGIACPPKGRVPKVTVDAWKQATGRTV